MMRKDPSVRLERLVVPAAIDESARRRDAEQEALVRRRARKLARDPHRPPDHHAVPAHPDLQSGRVIGFEALSRGPKGESGLRMSSFGSAYEGGPGGDVECVCREQAMGSIGKLQAEQLLFINMEPSSISTLA